MVLAHLSDRVNSPPAIRFDADARGPLHGLRVLDLSRLVAGNMLSLQLADFGADVIKIEPPEGDPLRHWRDAGHELWWKVYGRNKRSVVLNLRQPAAPRGAAAGYRPGTLEEMALGPDALLAANPDLIIVRISGFGQSGPYAPLPGFGTLVEAMSGVAARTGFADREPVLPPFPLADMTAGLCGAFAVVVAVREREQGYTRGQIIDLSLLESIFSILGPEAAIYRTAGTVKERVGSASHTSAPRNVYCCSDGAYVALSASTQTMARRVFAAIGRSEMGKDARFSTNNARLKHRALVDEMVGAWFASNTREQALAHMRAAGVTVAPVYTIADAVDDVHFRERQIVPEVEDRELGKLPMHAMVPRFSHTPGAWRRPAPRLGEHTEALLAEAGLDAAAIAALKRT